MRILKHKRLLVVGAFLMMASVNVIHSSGFASAGAFGGLGPYIGYFDQSSTSGGGTVIDGGVYVNSVPEFVQRLKQAKGQSARNSTGADFLVRSMMGYGPGAPRNVTSADIDALGARLSQSNVSITWSEYRSIAIDTYGTVSNATGQRDVAQDNIGTWSDSIVIRQNGVVRYVIQRWCANPDGAVSEPIQEAIFNLKPAISANPSSTDGDADVTITATVDNDGPSSSSNTAWEVTTYTLPASNTTAQTANGVRSSPEDGFNPRDHFGNNATTLSSGTGNYARNVSPVNTSQQTLTNLAVGTRICYALSMRPYNQVAATANNWRHSTPFCVRIGKAPKVQVLGNDLLTGRHFVGSTAPASPSNVQSSMKVKREPAVTPPFSSSMITGLWQTGVGNNGAKLNPGQSDPHWRLVNVYPGRANGTTLQPASSDSHWSSSNNADPCQPGPYPRAATVVNTGSVVVGANSAWNASLPNAAWIGAYSDAYNLDNRAGCTFPANSGTIDQATFERAPIWVFRLTNGFNVDSCVNPNTIRLNLSLSADDEAQVLVNGVSIAQPGNFRHYGQWPSYPVTYTTNPSSAFRTGNNSLEIRVKSAYQYTGLLVNSINVASAQCRPVQPQNTYGSWVEYGILSTGTVRGTASGSAYAGGAANPTYCQAAMLTFSNTPTGNVCVTNATLGGYSTGKTIPDIASYYPTTSSTPLLPASTSLTNVASGTYRAPADPTGLEITASSIPQGRTIVINAPNSTVTIRGDINYTTGPMAAADRIPQVVIIAKDIRIIGAVRNIDSWLVTRGTLNTCTDVSAMSSLTSNACQFTLNVNGPVQAGRLELWRTAGAGTAAQTGDPAEVFNLRPDAYLWGLSQSAQSGRLESVYEQELPPRF